MRKNATVRLYASVLFVLGTVVTASPARAQFIPRSVGDPVIGERYWVEGAVGLWSPGTEMAISSESLGIAGDVIDFKRDLGLTDQRFKEFHLQLRPARKHKFRFQYIPIKYDQQATLTRQIKFNGQLFTIGVPVTSQIDWRAYRFGYEYDAISRDRVFVGFVLDVKQTDVRAFLESPQVRRERAHAQAPIPAIGGIFRYYIVPNVSITGEITGFKLPESLIKDATGHYVDVDFYGTYNVTRNVGAQIGFRRFDLGYVVEKDTGDFDLRGIYFGLVARF